MGSIIWSRRALFESLGDFVGVKSGLALTNAEILSHCGDVSLRKWLEGQADEVVRLPATTYEDLVGHLLYRLGTWDTPVIPTVGMIMLSRFREDPRLNGDLEPLLTLDGLYNHVVTHKVLGKPLADADVEQLFLEQLGSTLGLEGLEVFKDAFRLVYDRSSFHGLHEVEWSDTKDLKDLFYSEDLKTMHGAFFDQRYIDYLSQNFDSIDVVNWRKFEGLAAEYLHRQGYRVKIGTGRNDGGVDLRAFDPADPDKPPLIIAQCKREKKKVDKIVVKALYADVVHERANSGLVITTNALSPGAKKVCKARAYPIAQADREKLRKWLSEMRSPRNGADLV